MQATDSGLKELRDLILGMDKKMDVFIARTDERFNAIDERFKFIVTQLVEIKAQLKSQDNRLWGFIAVLSVAVIGFLGKLAFFPDIKL
jgi:hypothetical protein